MTSNLNLKKMLVKLAGFTKADQRWILRHLPEKQKEAFKQRQGEQLLGQAQQFRKLKYGSKSLPEILPPLVPAYSQSLANYSVLYIAIVLEQGKFSWHEEFLRIFDSENTIRNLLENSLHHLKESARQALFKHWQSQQSFDVYLEQQHD